MWLEQEPQWDIGRVLGWFRLKLERGSGARTLFDVLAAVDKVSIYMLCTAFDAQYPPKPKSTKTVQDKWEHLEAHIASLTNESMLRRDDRGTPGYLTWAGKLGVLPKDIADMGGLLATQQRAKLPSALKEMVHTVSSFTDLAIQVKAVPRQHLEERVEAEKKLVKLMEMAEKASKARAAPDTPTQGATLALANMSFRRAKAPIQSLVNALASTMGTQPQRAQGGSGAFGGRRAGGGGNGGNQLARHTTEDLALCDQPMAQSYADFMRTKLRRATTRDEHGAQVAEYKRAHPNLLPTKQWPYPLSPGTADVASNKCYNCGMVHRRDVEHIGPRLEFEESNYRGMAGVVVLHHRRDGGGGAGGAGVAQVNMVDVFHLLQQLVGQQAATTGSDQEHKAHIEEMVE